ncbi:MAG: TIGR03668 family PPOX class F420-dependent oxidoreductase [Candidatus Limnocylindrales bacterium]|jgi:PPOX class probable F420-dependent enzyme
MELSREQRALLVTERRATLATIAGDGHPRLVPCCFAIGFEGGDLVIDTPVDDKPKAVADPMRLARVRDIRRDPRVTLLVDRWDEDWSRLAWVRVEGTARLLIPWSPRDASAHAAAVEELRSRYPQYREHRLEMQPVIRISVERMTGWDAFDHEAQREPIAAAAAVSDDDDRSLVDTLDPDRV